MEKPGPRTASAELIIEDPKLQSTGQKVLYGMLTLVFWMIWIYLWLPLITVAAWAFGVQRFVDFLLIEEGIEALTRVIEFYLVVVAVMCGALLAWANYNRLRFTGHERRKAVAVQRSSALLASALGRRESAALVWQHHKSLWVTHHADGRIALVEQMGEVHRDPALYVSAPIAGELSPSRQS